MRCTGCNRGNAKVRFNVSAVSNYNLLNFITARRWIYGSAFSALKSWQGNLFGYFNRDDVRFSFAPSLPVKNEVAVFNFAKDAEAHRGREGVYVVQSGMLLKPCAELHPFASFVNLRVLCEKTRK